VFLLTITKLNWKFTIIILITVTRSSANDKTARDASHWMQRILPPNCKTLHFSYSIPLVFLSRIPDHRIWSESALECRLPRHHRLSCDVPISTFCCSMWSQSTNVTDWDNCRNHMWHQRAPTNIWFHGPHKYASQTASLLVQKKPMFTLIFYLLVREVLDTGPDFSFDKLHYLFRWC